MNSRTFSTTSAVSTSFAPEPFGHFGDLGDSLFTLFQIMTGEAWSEVARAVMAVQPLAWVFFLAYIIVTTFTVLNLFIAVAVSAMQAQMPRHHEDEQGAALAEILAELRELRAMHERGRPQVQSIVDSAVDPRATT